MALGAWEVLTGGVVVALPSVSIGWEVGELIVRLAGDGRPVRATEVCECVGDAVGGEHSPRQVIGAGRDEAAMDGLVSQTSARPRRAS